MEFTNVLPGVKLVKQDEAGNEEELFVSDHIVHVHKDNGENEGIPFDTIDDIIKG